MNELGIIIPAAGCSKRMGQPKQLLLWNNKTLLNLCIEKALSITPAVCVVLGSDYESIVKSIDTSKVSVVLNNNWVEGIGSSIALGTSTLIREINNLKHIIVMLPDMPMLTSHHLERILRSADQELNDILVATKYNKSGVGPPALFSKSHFQALQELKGDQGAKHIILAEKFVSIAPNDPNQLIDIDTLEDYQNYMR